MHRRQFHAWSAVTAAALACPPLFAAEKETKWGDLSATFLYDGEPPERRELRIDKDPDFVKQPVLDPSLVVDAKKGIANVLVWLYVAPGGEMPPIHASYAELAKKELVIDRVNAQIEPHVSVIWTKQTLVIKNTDPIGHNLRMDVFSNATFGELIPARDEVKRKFSKQETRPAPLSCSIHPWESGYLLIRGNPYMAVSRPNGKLQIKNLPVGPHTFVFWHELPGFITEVKRDGKLQKLEKGRLTVDIKPGENNLGEIVLKPERRP